MGYNLLFRFKYWLQSTKTLFTVKTSAITTANNLTKTSNLAIKHLKQSKRNDLGFEHFHSVLSTLLGIYFTSNTYHRTVQSLLMSGFGQNAFNIVRVQLESLLIFLYFIESNENLKEIEKRINLYEDWTIIKMYQNTKRSSDLDIVKLVPDHKKFQNSVKKNYDEVLTRYKKERNLDKLTELQNMNSFVPNKNQILQRYKIKDLYNHIQAECSATIHVADLSDRMVYEEFKGFHAYVYNKNIDDGFWSMTLSNYVQLHLMINFVKFFQLDDNIISKLKKVFK